MSVRAEEIRDEGAPAPSGAGADFEACREIVRKRARNFYYGLRLTPEPRRSAVYAIYAWMRLGDDIADDEEAPVERRRAGLARFREVTEGVLARRAAPDRAGGVILAGELAVWRALGATLGLFPVEERDIRAMMDGLEEDIEHAGYERADELESYCARVASSVGRVCLSIWGLRDGADARRANELADRRGLAFQLTNILRDFAEDYDGGRVYLARESFQRFGVTPGGLRSWSPAGACAGIVQHWAAVTRGHYDASAELESMVHPSCAPTLWAMTRIYAGLLERIERDPSSVAGEERIRLPSITKAGIALKAALLSRRERW